MRKKSLDQIAELLERHGLPATETEVDVDPELEDVRATVDNDAPAATAFEALRRSVDASRTGTFTHQAHLALIHRALLRAGGPKAPLVLVADLLRQVGVAVERDVTRSELFTDHGGGSGGETELVDPAYVDERSGRVVQQGIVSRRAAVSA